MTSQDLVDPLALRGGQRAQNSVGAGAALARERQLAVLEHGQALEHRRLLELAADAEIGDRRLVEPGQVDARRRT